MATAGAAEDHRRKAKEKPKGPSPDLLPVVGFVGSMWAVIEAGSKAAD